MDHYRTRHPKRLRGEVPRKTLLLIRKALSAYPLEDVCRAIDTNAASKFHRENNHMGAEPNPPRCGENRLFPGPPVPGSTRPSDGRVRGAGPQVRGGTACEADDLDLATMLRLMGDLTAAHGSLSGPPQDGGPRSTGRRCRATQCGRWRRRCVMPAPTSTASPKPSHLRALIATARGKPPDPPDRRPGDLHDLRHALPVAAAPAHWIPGYQSLECDCAWRMIVHGYGTDDDLATMGQLDSFAAASAAAREECLMRYRT